MSEDTEEVESSSEEASGDGPSDSKPTATHAESRHGVTDAKRGEAKPTLPSNVDRAAESFLSLEADLAQGEVSGSAWGRAVDVERIPAAEVPDSYPVDIRTDEVLALTLEVEGTESTVYFPWDDGPDVRLQRLLALKDIPEDRFADLHGGSLLLTVEEGHYVPVVPSESPRGSPLGVFGVGAGLGLNLLVALLGAVGLGGALGSVPVVALWLLVNLVGLPASTYLDAWHLRTRTDWDGGPLFWTLLGAIPGVNVVSSATYLLKRLGVTPLGYGRVVVAVPLPDRMQ